jgi:hypothetical protein
MAKNRPNDLVLDIDFLEFDDPIVREHSYTGDCCDKPMEDHTHVSTEWIRAQRWNFPWDQN